MNIEQRTYSDPRFVCITTAPQKDNGYFPFADDTGVSDEMRIIYDSACQAIGSDDCHMTLQTFSISILFRKQLLPVANASLLLQELLAQACSCSE